MTPFLTPETTVRILHLTLHCSPPIHPSGLKQSTYVGMKMRSETIAQTNKNFSEKMWINCKSSKYFIKNHTALKIRHHLDNEDLEGLEGQVLEESFGETLALD